MMVAMIARLLDVLGESDARIRKTRTLAPAIWAAIISTGLAYGVDVQHEIARIDGPGGVLTPMTVAAYGPLVLFAVLYLVAGLSPKLERWLLVIAKRPTYEPATSINVALPEPEGDDAH